MTRRALVMALGLLTAAPAARAQLPNAPATALELDEAPEDLLRRRGRRLLLMGWAGSVVMGLATAAVLRRGCDDRSDGTRCSFREVDGLALGWAAMRLTAGTGSTVYVGGVLERARRAAALGFGEGAFRRARRAYRVQWLGLAGPAALAAYRADEALDAQIAASPEAAAALAAPDTSPLADTNRALQRPRRIMLSTGPLMVRLFLATTAFAPCLAAENHPRSDGGRAYCRQPLILTATLGLGAHLAFRVAAAVYATRLLRHVRALRRSGADVSLRPARKALAWSILLPVVGQHLARTERNRLLRLSAVGN